MARIRSIKPEFWTSEQIVECSANARLLFIGLWNFCDDYGVHPASCSRLKMEVFPNDKLDSVDIRRMIDELIEHKLLVQYVTDGEEFWFVTGWDKHQKPDTKTGKWPRPNGLVGNKIRRKNADHSANGSGMDTDHSPTDKVLDTCSLIRGEVTPKAPKGARRIKLPEDFTLTDHRKNLALEYWRERCRPDLSPEDEMNKFRVYHKGHGTKMEDWDCAWVTWYGNAITFNKPPANQVIGFPAQDANKKRPLYGETQ